MPKTTISNTLFRFGYPLDVVANAVRTNTCTVKCARLLWLGLRSGIDRIGSTFRNRRDIDTLFPSRVGPTYHGVFVMLFEVERTQRTPPHV